MITLIIIIALTIPFAVFFVRQQEVKAVERFGKFMKIAQPGINFKAPFIDWVRGNMSLRIQQLDVKVETKTKDNVFVILEVSVQYHVLAGKEYDAFYKLENAEAQINSYIFDVVRAEIPKMNLDEVFEKKDDVAIAVKKELSKTMDDFGYSIVKALITDIDPNESVKAAMNKINATERLKIAAANEAEALKIKVVKEAEAEAESKKLQGQGMANMRTAIMKGLKDSVEDFQKGVSGVSTKEALELLVMTNYFDTIQGLNAQKVIFLPSSPAGLKDIAEQIRGGILSAEESKI